MLIDPYRYVIPPETFQGALAASSDGNSDGGTFSTSGNSRFNWGTGNFTIEAWANKIDLTDSGSYRIARAVSGSGGLLRAWAFRLPSGITADTTTMQLVLNNGATTTTATSSSFTAVPAGTYAHYAVVVDRGADTAEFFLNGTSISSHSIAAFSGLSPTNINQTVTVMGALYGGLDDLRIWDIARSDADIAADYAAPLVSPFDTDIVAYWKFNEGSGTTAEDEITSLAITLADSGGWTTGPP